MPNGKDLGLDAQKGSNRSHKKEPHKYGKKTAKRGKGQGSPMTGGRRR